MTSPEVEIERLRADNEALRATNDSLLSAIKALETALQDQKQAFDKVVEELQSMQRRFLGKKSERNKPVKVPTPDTEAREKRGVKKPADKTQATRKRRARQRDKVITERVPHPVPEPQRSCPHCGNHDLSSVGEGRVTHLWEYVPGYFVRQKHVQETLSCSCGDYIVTAPPPPRPFDNGKYGPRFISHLVVGKCLDAFPLHRLERRFERQGIPMSRSTMNDLLHRMAEELEPLIRALFALVIAAPVVQADETSIKIQNRDKRGFVWTFVTDQAVVFRLSPDRSGHTPREVLGGTQGVLLVDGYTGYNQVVGVDGRIRAMCNAHARRKLFEAKEQAPEAVEEALSLYLDAYMVDRRAKELGIYGTDEHLQIRQSESQHAMDLLKEWLTDQQPLHPPKSKLGRAIRYALKHWEPLTYFLDDPAVPIDNNKSESQLRAIALGRHNYLFVGHEEAGQNLMGLQSLVASCVINDVNPEAYLADVIMRVGSHPASRLADLLPHNWSPP